MSRRACLLLAIGATLMLLSPTEATGPCKVQSPNACWNQTQFNQLSTINQANYCEQATLQVVQASICYTACGFPTPSDLTSLRASIDSFCNTASSGNCSSVTSSYASYVACYDSVGGVEAGVQALVQQFNSKSSTDTPCRQLQTARSCQIPYRPSTCLYLIHLDQLFIAANPDILFGLAICGSEAVPALVPLTARTDGCSPNLSSMIESQCNISCDLANNASDTATFCTLLQKQADCIYSLSAGCSSAQAQYLLPRFDSYAIANFYLGCSVKVKNAVVQARLNSKCNYVDQINTCFFYQNKQETVVFDLLHQLFNRDTPALTFCQDLANSSSAISSCSVSLLLCTTPHSQLYPKPTVYTDSYAPLMGVYPLNVWGVTSIFNWLRAMPSCSGTPWTDRICLPPPTTTTITTTTVRPSMTTTPAAGPTAVRESRPTPSVASTTVQPTPAQSGGAGASGTPPPVPSTTAGMVQPGGPTTTISVIVQSNGSGQKPTTRSSNNGDAVQAAVKASGSTNTMSISLLICCFAVYFHL